jgi:hypothetical protein
MRDNLVMDLLMRGSSIIPFSVFGNDVNNVPAGLLINDGGVIKQAVFGFKNAGTDAITINSSDINNFLRPDVDSFTMRFRFAFNSVGVNANYLFSKAPSPDALATQQLGAFIRGSLMDCSLRVGGQEQYKAFAPIALKWYDVVVSSSPSTSRMWIDGVLLQDFAQSGTATNAEPLRICGFAVSGSFNSEASFVNWEFFEGYTSDGSTGSLVKKAKFMLNESAGSTVVYDSINGYTATVLDGSPSGAIGTKMLVPWSLLT